MKIIVYILAMLIGITSINADALTKTSNKKKSKVESKKITPVDPAYVIGIGYPTIIMAINSVKERKDTVLKANNKPFGWQERVGPWYVVKEGKNIEWAFTEGGHYAHPSVIKRMIDVGSTDHLNVDMAFRCEAEIKTDCVKLLSEFKEVNKLINKVYQKKFITSPDGEAVWKGVDSLE
ncbi:hypothetical protein [Methylotenera sp.]|uniref:hypothetical protein n=1 Tax=Methylotenera sp. TaxID=2051956 RepID=UPI00248865E3|nr:hypothetical protein [Methylotenera sp.]MDI1298660.1 hypothetical protein [Methylotenera sp.]